MRSVRNKASRTTRAWLPWQRTRAQQQYIHERPSFVFRGRTGAEKTPAKRPVIKFSLHVEGVAHANEVLIKGSRTRCTTFSPGWPASRIAVTETCASGGSC